jgi:glycosyltransferase involved in cell wall biosynthesis
MIPVYNEEKNIKEIYDRIIELFNSTLAKYSYEILFIDNYSTDLSRNIIMALASKDPGVKAIFNVRNFGWVRSSFYGLINTIGDAVIFLAADLQEPVELIPQFIVEWENGNKIVIGVKHKSRENRIKYILRTIYYKLITHIADIEQIEHFMGFGLYDKKFIEILRTLNDPMPYFRGIVSELGYKQKIIYYEQQKRYTGKSKLFSFYKNYDLAMLGITAYSKVVMRIATIAGFISSIFSLLVAIFYLVYKLLRWESFALGMAPVIIGVFFLGSLQLFFIGLLGEYILNINTKVTNRPLVIEESRINFD